MDNQVMDRVAEEYERRQRENRMEEDRRRQEIAQKHPELDRLLRERHQMILRSVRGAFSGGAPEDPERAMAEYNRRISGMLAEKGYPGEYLAPVCACPLCRDTGYVYEASVQRRCECFQAAYLRALSETGARQWEEASFARFDESRFPDTPLPGTDVTQREYMRVVRDRCVQYAAGVPGGLLTVAVECHGYSETHKPYLACKAGEDGFTQTAGKWLFPQGGFWPVRDPEYPHHDLEEMFLDSFLTIGNVPDESVGFILSKLNSISDKYQVNFTISISMDADNIPDDFKKDIVISL